MKLSPQIVLIIVVVIVVLAVLFLQSSSSTKNDDAQTVTPSSTSSNGGYSDVVNINGGGVFTDIDLSGIRTLKFVNISNLVARSLTFPKVTKDPVSIVLVNVGIEETIDDIPEKLSAFAFIGVERVNWTKVLPKALKSGYLYGFAIFQIDEAQVDTLIDLGDIIVGQKQMFTLLARLDVQIMIDAANILSSVGNISMPAHYGDRGDLLKINVINCTNITSIGSITAVFTDTTSDMQVGIVNNPLLTTVGDIEVGSTTIVNISGNPALTSIGSVTIGGASVNPALMLNNNAFDAATISQVLIDVDATGVSNGALSFAGNPGNTFGSFTLAGQAAYTSLQGKSWTLS